jgi:hypothetical protein
MLPSYQAAKLLQTEMPRCRVTEWSTFKAAGLPICRDAEPLQVNVIVMNLNIPMFETPQKV